MSLIQEEEYTNTNGKKFNIRIIDDGKEILAAINEYSERDNPDPVVNWENLTFPKQTPIPEVLIKAKQVANGILTSNV
jgi:hypothetical protein